MARFNRFGNSAKSEATIGTAPLPHSPNTNLTKTPSWFTLATPKMQLQNGRAIDNPSPYLMEFDWGKKDRAVEIRINGSMGYQAMPFRIQ